MVSLIIQIRYTKYLIKFWINIKILRCMINKNFSAPLQQTNRKSK